jgi:protoporphyrin/coproporphyrin ferrochelatase
VRYSPPLFPAHRLDPSQPTGLLLLGMGGPDSASAIAPFLRNLFADPLVLPLPAWLSRPLGHLIVRRRLREVTGKYARLGCGGGSPQLDWTVRQAAALAARLTAHGLAIRPAVAMRYWHPLSAAAVGALREQGCRQLLVVPTYPQYSVATTGSSLGELERALAAAGWDPPRHVLRQWPLLPGYIDLLARQAADVLARWRTAGLAPRQTALVYTAHSLPARFVQQGDPYLRQTRATVRYAHARLRELLAGPQWLDGLGAGGREPVLVFQSKVGPVRWLAPATERTCLDLAADGVRHLLVVPVSFSCEHIETSDELDHELQAAVRAAGVVDFARTPALNLDVGWLRSLGDHLAWRAFGQRSAARERKDHDG